MWRALAMVAVALVACKDAKPPRAADTAVAGASAVPVTTGAPTCARTGHWTDCQIRIRLEQSGLAPQKADKAVGELPKIDGTPILVTIGNAGMAAYLYADTIARHRAAASLDTLKFIPQNKPVGIRGEATLIQNDNMLALLYSKNDHQRERVSDAITAGPSQP